MKERYRTAITLLIMVPSTLYVGSITDAWFLWVVLFWSMAMLAVFVTVEFVSSRMWPDVVLFLGIGIFWASRTFLIVGMDTDRAWFIMVFGMVFILIGIFLCKRRTRDRRRTEAPERAEV